MSCAAVWSGVLALLGIIVGGAIALLSMWINRK
jgi:hypothetical protein